MGLCKRVALLRAADFVSNDRLAACPGALQCGGECWRVAKRFEEKQNNLCVGIVHQGVDNLAHRHVTFIADRNRLGKTKASRSGSSNQRAHHGAALRDQAKFAA